MPPASPAATRVLRIASRIDVFPWSTWPSTVTLGGHRLDLEAELVGDDLGRSVVDHLVDLGQDAVGDQLLLNVGRVDAELLSQVAHGDVGRQRDLPLSVDRDLG